MNSRIKINRLLCTLLVPLLMAVSIPSAWAVYAQAEGDTITFRNNDGTPLANATLTGLFEGQEVTATTDEEGKLRICRRGEEGDKRLCGLILDGDGSGSLGSIDFTFQNGVVDIGFWDGLSQGAKIGTVAGTALVVGGGVYLVTKDDDNGGGSGGQVPPSNGGSGGPPPGGTPPSPSATLNVSCSPIFNPQNSFQFLAPEIVGNWFIQFNPSTNALSITLPNGVQLNGTLQGDQANASGTGNFTGVNTTAQFTGTINLASANLSGVLEVGPPLGGGPADEVDSQCNHAAGP